MIAAIALLLTPWVRADIAGSTLVPHTSYVAGETNRIVYACMAHSCDDEWIRMITLQYPTSVIVVAGWDSAGDQAALVCTIASGSLVQVQWTSADANLLFALPPDLDTNQLGAVSDGHMALLTNDVYVPLAVNGPLGLACYLHGDTWGVGQHAATNNVVLWPVPEPILTGLIAIFVFRIWSTRP